MRGIKRHFRQTPLLFFGVLLMLCYQNCSSEFSALKDKQTSLGSSAQSAQFQCADPSLNPTLPAIVLSKKQYENSLSDLFGASILQSVKNELTTFLADSNDVDTHERTTELTAQRIEAYELIARAVSGVIVGNVTMRERVFGTCSSVAAPAPSCIDGYLNGFAKRILRRPLTEAEKTTARGIANIGGDYLTNLKAVLSMHLQSPFFTWRLELGNSSQTSSTDITLTQYEIASRISFESADMPPDQALMDAADRNELSDLVKVKAQVLRLMSSAHGKEKVQNNLMRWSLSDRVANIESLPLDFKGDVVTTGLSDAILSETRAYIDHMVFTKKASYADLLTSKISFASHPGLAKIYDHAPVSGTPAEFGGRRQGLLMRSAFMTGGSTRTSLISRGVEFQKRILCNVIPSPTADIVDLRMQAPFTHEELLFKTTREAITRQTAAAVCMGCHSVINPTGFAFESMDSFGRYRTAESIFDGNTYVRSIDVDASARVPIGGGQVAPVQDAYDLMSFVAVSPRASACFTRNVYRFIHEKQETEADACNLASIHNVVADPKKPLIDGLVEAIASRAVFIKHVQ